MLKFGYGLRIGYGPCLEILKWIGYGLCVRNCNFLRKVGDCYINDFSLLYVSIRIKVAVELMSS